MITKTIKERKNNRSKKQGSYNEQRIIDGLKRRIKRKFGFTPKDSEIRKVWKNYCGMIGEGLAKNEVVKLDKKNKLFVMGERITEGTTAHRLLSQGKILSGNKIVKVKQMNARHLGIKYKIEFEHTGNVRDDVYFTADKKLSGAVHNALMNTQVNYSIKPCQ
jgi:hypothetical protein